MDDVFVRVVDLPYRIDGTTVLDDNGDYNVYINARVSYEMQRISLKHELSHISKNHFYDSKPLDADELEANMGETESVDPNFFSDVKSF